MKIKELFVAVWLCVSDHGFAQSFSRVNAVGYVNTTLHPGFNLVANPLNALDNSIGSLFVNFEGGVPDGTTVYKLGSNDFISATYMEVTGQFEPPEAAAETTGVGEGVWVFLPATTDRVLTLVGEILQGDICIDIPTGYSIRANLIPARSTVEDLEIPYAEGDELYTYDTARRNFTVYSFGLSPDPLSIDVGQAFIYFHGAPATTWCRTFFVHNPG
jgi:hypothetical protein